MRFSRLSLPDVICVEPKIFRDDRGHFLENYHRTRFAEAGISAEFVQDNQSFSRRDTLRGLHYQCPNGQGKLVGVAFGTVFDVAVDVRRHAPTFGVWTGMEISAENHRMLWIPPGFAHGFCVLSETAVFAYKCTDFYAPESEHTVLWNDPDIGIDWPVANPIVSPKDQKGLALHEIKEEHLPN